MEWVETTGRSVEEAKEAALDELGVDEADAEFEVIAETQTGLFGPRSQRGSGSGPRATDSPESQGRPPGPA